MDGSRHTQWNWNVFHAILISCIINIMSIAPRPSRIFLEMTLRALISHTTSLLPSTLCWMSIRHFQFEVYRPDTGLGVTHLQLKWNIRILINNSLISPRFVLPALVNWSTINTQVDGVPFLTPDISYWVAVYRSLAHTTIYWVFVIFGDWCHDCATFMHLVIRVFVIITDVLFRLSI